MITALTFISVEKNNIFKKLYYKFKSDKTDIKIEQARGVNIKHIKYTSYSGKLKLEMIDKYIGAQRNHLVCSDSLKFPLNCGYKRFESYDFTIRLCTNMALAIIRNHNNPKSLRIGLYDVQATSADLLPLMLKFCSDIVVVTQNEPPYYQALDTAMEELGATAIVTKNIGELDNCNLIIAPQIISEILPIKQSAVVMTIDCPKIPILGNVFYKYYFKMPNGFDRIKPDELSEEYFCSVLYSLGAQYELGSIEPTICSNGITSQTVNSLLKLLEV